MDKLAKLKAKTIIDLETGCWLWTGYTNEKGYGQTHFRGRTVTVHRLSAYFNLGMDLGDKSQQALHKRECKNRNCWNPLHLYIGTPSDNINDSVAVGAMSIHKTHCIHGHELIDENIYLGSAGERNCKICAKQRAQARYELIK